MSAREKPWAMGLLVAATSLVAGAGVYCENSRVARDRFGEIHSVDVVKVHVDESVKGCEAFSLDSDQIRFFFRNAKIISEFEMEKEYPYYPCWVEGTLTSANGEFSWLVGGGGTGGVWKSKNSITYLACEQECENMFISVGKDQAIGE